MSKNNNYNKQYRNYNNYSNNAGVKPAEPVVEEKVEEVTPVTEEVEQVEVEELAAEMEEPVVEPIVEAPAPVIGVVNCPALRMRSAANTNAEVLTTLSEGTELQVNKAESTADFYKVTTTAGAEGFCMKKFVTIK